MNFKNCALIILLLNTAFSYAQHITHGPVVGGVSPNSARMYVRTTQAAPLLIELSADQNFTSVL